MCNSRKRESRPLPRLIVWRKCGLMDRFTLWRDKPGANPSPSLTSYKNSNKRSNLSEPQFRRCEMQVTGATQREAQHEGGQTVRVGRVGGGGQCPYLPSAFPTPACSLPRILTRNERWRKVKETEGRGERSTVSKRAHMKWRMGAALTHIMPFGFLLFLFNWRVPFHFFLFNFFNFTFSHSETFIIFTLTKIRIVLRILTWNRRLHTSSLKSSKKWGF